MLREVTQKLDPKRRSADAKPQNRKKSAGNKIQFAKRGRVDLNLSQRQSKVPKNFGNLTPSHSRHTQSVNVLQPISDIENRNSGLSNI